MKKKTVTIAIIFLFLTFAVYNQFNKPDVDSYSIVHDIETYSSPDNRHEILMQLCYSHVSGSSRYIMGTLIERNVSVVSSKMIYWDIIKDEDQSNALINVEWLDITTVKIGDIKFDISNYPNVDTYNYRAA